MLGLSTLSGVGITPFRPCPIKPEDTRRSEVLKFQSRGAKALLQEKAHTFVGSSKASLGANGVNRSPRMAWTRAGQTRTCGSSTTS
jgi:hypothetical protein